MSLFLRITYNETNGIYGDGGANNVVVRNNDMIQTFNGVLGYGAAYNRYNSQNYDIYNNYMADMKLR